MNSNNKEKIILSIGGSLIVSKNGINTKFLSQLNKFIRDELIINSKRQFFLVIGGGAIARQYRDAGRVVVGHEITEEDQDWLGVHATRLNAHLIRTIFHDIAHPNIIKDYNVIQKAPEQVVIAAGWKPGWSTDYCAVLLCEDYRANKVINLSNISQAYTKDPDQFPDAKPVSSITWEEFRQIVGDKWSPGIHAPFDPVASRKAEELKIEVIVLNGENFDNLKACLQGETFIGTTIK